MSNHCINWARMKPCPNPTTKLVLILLANYADDLNRCFPSEAHLAQICGITDRSVRRAISSLVKAGYLDVEKRTGRTNLYTLRVDTGVRLLRTRASAYTSNTKKRPTGRSLNDIAG